MDSQDSMDIYAPVLSTTSCAPMPVISPTSAPALNDQPVVSQRPPALSHLKHDPSPFALGQDSIQRFVHVTYPPQSHQHHQHQLSIYEHQAMPDCLMPSTPTEVIGSSLEEMGKTLSQAGGELKSGLVDPTVQVPILQQLVHKISSEVDRLAPSFDALSLAPPPQQPQPPAPPPPAGPLPQALFDLTLSGTLSRKRAASPLSLDPSRPQKSLRSMKVEPTDEPLNPLPMSSAVSPGAYVSPLTSPPIPTTQSMNPGPPPPPPSTALNGFDISPMALGDPISPSQPSSVAPWGPSTSSSGPVRHQHSLSAPSVVPRPSPMPLQPGRNSTHLGRMSRSGSFGSNYPQLANTMQQPYDYVDPSHQHSFNTMKSQSQHVSPPPQWPANVALVPPSELIHSLPSAPPWSPATDANPHRLTQAPRDRSPQEDNELDADDEQDDDCGGHSRSDGSGVSTPGDIPAEYHADVDRIFFGFLNYLCSNLDATDSKGEPIHQTLMAKKMKRLDESGDFRPFKFRIAAFTSKFLERLAEEGYPEDKIPMKKVRNYLWHQPYILRFNEEGKKAKSKGNHIWNIDARKVTDGKWEFRPFQRRLAGFPTGIAYRGIHWSYTARIWDPQSSWQNVPVTYHSPNLPSWLSWKDNVLSGVPGPDAVSCDIVVIAKYNFHGQEGQLVHTFQLSVAPQSLDSGTTPRRTATTSEQRSASDDDSLSYPRRNSSPLPVPSDILHVMEDLKAQASNDLGSHAANGMEFQNLVKQAHVLEKTVNALVESKPHSETQALCNAANGIVASAARAVFSRRSPPRPPSMNEVSCLTKAAISKAVVLNGTGSNEVDIILTADSLIKKEHGMSLYTEAPLLASPV